MMDGAVFHGVKAEGFEDVNNVFLRLSYFFSDPEEMQKASKMRVEPFLRYLEGDFQLPLFTRRQRILIARRMRGVVPPFRLEQERDKPYFRHVGSISALFGAYHNQKALLANDAISGLFGMSSRVSEPSAGEDALAGVEWLVCGVASAFESLALEGVALKNKGAAGDASMPKKGASRSRKSGRAGFGGDMDRLKKAVDAGSTGELLALLKAAAKKAPKQVRIGLNAFVLTLENVFSGAAPQSGGSGIAVGPVSFWAGFFLLHTALSQLQNWGWELFMRGYTSGKSGFYESFDPKVQAEITGIYLKLAAFLMVAGWGYKR